MVNCTFILNGLPFTSFTYDGVRCTAFSGNGPHRNNPSSGNVPNNLTKGTGTNLSALIFGNWSDLLVGQWGGIDLSVDEVPEAAKGNVKLVAHSEWDIAVRHAESFAAIKDIVTA